MSEAWAAGPKRRWRWRRGGRRGVPPEAVRDGRSVFASRQDQLRWWHAPHKDNTAICGFCLDLYPCMSVLAADELDAIRDALAQAVEERIRLGTSLVSAMTDWRRAAARALRDRAFPGEEDVARARAETYQRCANDLSNTSELIGRTRPRKRLPDPWSATQAAQDERGDHDDDHDHDDQPEEAGAGGDHGESVPVSGIAEP